MRRFFRHGFSYWYGAASVQSLSQGEQPILSDLAEANIAEVATAQIALPSEPSATLQPLIDQHLQRVQALNSSNK
ncbi:hypothetical protein KW842_21745 [Duganella sp. sic0402]|uniref:hypothetical protein n=1 Tax=Duganella sp. sic0402 TaxID=2854786 RepID=UPI001C458295|nr:hypothetical protein [Duganella sp. sic0402]MBV7538402.1 hypothetical protein [Duganella sp. sic0402]